jgi:hypothetical protein
MLNRCDTYEPFRSPGFSPRPISSLYPSFTDFSIKFSPLYLISLQQRSLNLILYTRNVFCSKFLYVRIYHTSNAMDIFYFYLIQCLKRKEKIEKSRENLYI